MKLAQIKDDSPKRRLILRIFERSALDALEKQDRYQESLLPEIPKNVLANIKSEIESIGFKSICEKNGVYEYRPVDDESKFSKTWSVRAYVSRKEIWFSSPITRSYNSSLIFECFQSAAEIIGDQPLIVYDTHMCEWLDYNRDPIVIRKLDRYS